MALSGLKRTNSRHAVYVCSWHSSADLKCPLWRWLAVAYRTWRG